MKARHAWIGVVVTLLLIAFGDPEPHGLEVVWWATRTAG